MSEIFSLENSQEKTSIVEGPNKDDDIMVEDIPDLEELVHEKLPSADEYKSNMQSKSVTSNKLRYQKIAAVILVVTSLACSVIFVATSSIEKTMSPRFEEVAQFLHKNNVSNLVYLNDPKSPQHKAARFIADGDAYKMELTEDNINRFAERYILAVIFYGADGQNWMRRLNFLSAEDHCTWWQKDTSNVGRDIGQGVKCDEDGRIVELNLSYNNLKSNEIPEEIEFLAMLQTLHMYDNNLGGYFPAVFNKMPNLKGIGLMNTGMRGPIPAWIGEMTQLTALGLSNNDFDGAVPISLSKLTKLNLLALDGNKLEGDVSIFDSLDMVEGLFLDHNSFWGETSAFDKLTNLISLDVSHNHLYGTLPLGLLNHPKIEVLDVSNNALSGDFPDDILQNSKLEYLSVAMNAFTGKFSARFGFLKKLKHIDVSNNQFTGAIPDTITQLTGLKYLSTSMNKFDEQNIPDLSRLTDLVDVDMKGNNLRGTIPQDIDKLENLIMLDLSSNDLTGTIPGGIGGLSNLNFLLLNRNKLSGDFPVEMTSLKSLQVLLLDKNDFKANAQDMCDSGVAPEYFISDCYPGYNIERPEVECRCCTQCCMDLDFDCNNKEWSANVDLQYEYGYRRDSYTFSIRDVPVLDSDNQEDDPTTQEDPNLP